MVRFLAFTALGTGLWSFFLAWAGWMLGANWSRVAGFVSHYQNAVVVLFVVTVFLFFLQRLRTKMGHYRS